MGIVELSKASQDYVITKIQEAIKTAPCGPERIAAINNGICYILGIEWLKIVLEEGPTDTNTGEVRDRVKNFNLKEQVDNNLLYYKMLANNYIGYLTNHQAMLDDPSNKNLVFQSDGEMDKAMVQMCSKKTMTVKDIYPNDFKDNNEAKKLMTNIFLAAKVRYFLLSIYWSGNGHLMAGVCLPEGAILFFDPNNGVYLMGTAGDLMGWICGKYKVESFRLLDVAAVGAV